ncbi:RNA polymerase sigma factor [Carboxylicivirga taeanensis]|uniref:RNA polymerase sigma factor n=1 Tax=Carboxylicivirga taeanensis TaxID=1416875 RepID=UPI003F6E1553
MTKPNTNQLLIDAIKIGDKAAFDELFRRYYDTVCRFALTITHAETDAEECVQEVFVRMWEKKKQLNKLVNIKSYLFKSTYNQCLWHLKKRKTQVHYENEYAIGRPANLSDEEGENWDAFRPFIQTAVNNLPDKCRQIFLLRRYEGLTNNEIADYLNISTKTVENQLAIAISKLRSELKPHIKHLIILFFIEHF